MTSVPVPAQRNVESPTVKLGARQTPVPIPETAGQVVRHPRTGALAIAVNAKDRSHPDPGRTPCYVVIEGAEHHRGHQWLTYNEVLYGGWLVVGDVHNLLAS